MKKGQVEYLKFCAFMFMICDHVGAYLLPEFPVFRLVGRLAFPLFAFALVQGFKYTSSFQRYSKRVLFLALLWQIPYTVLYKFGYFPPSEPFNFVWILCLGLLFLNSIKEKKFVLAALIFSSALLLDVLKFSIPYGSYGLAVIGVIYFFDANLFMLFCASFFLSIIPIYVGVYPFQQIFASMFVVLLAFPLTIRIFPRLFYYAAYPVHLMAIFGVKYLCGV